MQSIVGSRKLLAFLMTLFCMTYLKASDSLSDEALMVVMSAALGGFFTANVMAARASTAAQGASSGAGKG